MATVDDADGTAVLDALRADVARQGNHVRGLKKAGTSKNDLKPEIAKLKELKAQLTEMEKKFDTSQWHVDREKLDELLVARMFVVPSWQIYNGVSGLYDFGPPGCAIKDNILSLWRRHFIIEDQMLQVESSVLVPEPVLEASGHKALFADLMVKDTVNGECFRADKLLEDVIDQKIKAAGDKMPAAEKEALLVLQRRADAMSKEELGAKLRELEVVSPTSGEPLTDPFPFNLMFETMVGPAGNSLAYLRPETAQGIFVNYPGLRDYHAQALPFTVACVGLAFRNEIAPRHGLIRVREFTMAEIEHFVDPLDKSHKKFHTVADVVLQLFPEANQLSDGKTLKMSAKDAVASGVIGNETLMYFMCRTFLFLTRIGLQERGIRFRQHLRAEQAHYSTDCWDAEVLTSFGWVEAVGHADRSAHDLTSHHRATGTHMSAQRPLAEPRVVDTVAVTVDKKTLGKELKRNSQPIIKYLTELEDDAAKELDARLNDGDVELKVGDVTATLKRSHMTLVRGTKTLQTEAFLPHVIEPSFGIGRIMVALFEHRFIVREGSEKRRVMQLPVEVAPVKCSVLPVDSRTPESTMQMVSDKLTAHGISRVWDTSGASIGRKYCRTDELGIPYAITVELDSHVTRSVTLRERDSTRQIRVGLEQAADLVLGLTLLRTTFEELLTRFPEHFPPGAAPTPAAGAGAGSSAGAGAGAAAGASAATVVEQAAAGVGRFSRPAVPIL